MILDNTFNFAFQQSLSGTSDQLSTNVYDAGAAVKAFGGGGVPPKISIQVTAVGGTSPTFRARFVGADSADLATNPIILDDTGASRVLTATDLPLPIELKPNNQLDAKRYYGVVFTQAGTTPTATANANLVIDSQSNLLH